MHSYYLNIYVYVCLYFKENEGETKASFPLILHYDELYNYFIIYHGVIRIEIKCTINAMHLIIPKLSPFPHLGPWKNCLP